MSYLSGYWGSEKFLWHPDTHLDNSALLRNHLYVNYPPPTRAKYVHVPQTEELGPGQTVQANQLVTTTRTDQGLRVSPISFCSVETSLAA